MVMTKNRKENIFIDRNFNVNRQVFTPATRRKDLQQARVIRERRKTVENKNMSIKDLLNSRLKEAQPQKDTIPSDSVDQTELQRYSLCRFSRNETQQCCPATQQR